MAKCKYCYDGVSLLKEDSWEVWIDCSNRLQIYEGDDYRNTYIDIKYCPMCGKKLEK